MFRLQYVIAAATIALCGANSSDSIVGSGNFSFASQEFSFDSVSFTLPSGSREEIVQKGISCGFDFLEEFGEVYTGKEVDERLCEVDSCLEFLNAAQESGIPPTELGQRQIELCSVASIQAMVSIWAMTFALSSALFV